MREGLCQEAGAEGPLSGEASEDEEIRVRRVWAWLFTKTGPAATLAELSSEGSSVSVSVDDTD